MRNILHYGSLAIATAAACLSQAASPTVAPSPAIPAYGQQVEVGVSNSEFPFFLPATRFTRNGTQITVEYEYSTNGWDVGTPSYGMESVGFGELPPGNYTVTALLHD